jgi:hypothetical protein
VAATIVSPSDPIPVKHLCVLLYGQPGSRKTSLAQTTDHPITFAFDPGIYRAHGRKAAVFFDSWADVVKFDTSPYKTVVVDTIGMCLDKLAAAIIAESPKNGNRMGGLSLPGFGALKESFKQWVALVRDRGQDLVFVAHEKAEKNGDEPYYCPDIVGGSYNTLMNVCDAVGYLHFEAGRRVIDFAPTDRFMAKVPPWDRDSHIALPDFSKSPTFLADLIAEAKASMGRVSAASAEVSKTVKEWADWLADPDVGLADVNAKLPDLSKLDKAAKAQVWGLIEKEAAECMWDFDKATKTFVQRNGKETAA